MRFKTGLLWSLVCLCGMSSAANAATVSLELVLNPAAPGCVGCTLSGVNTWNLIAKDITGAAEAQQSFGISAFSIPVLGVSSVLNRSPRTNVDEEGESLPAGFTLARSGNNGVVTPGGFLVGGAQDNATPTPFLIRGYGKESSGFSTKLPGKTLLPTQTQVSWNSGLVLAEGRYTASSTPSINFQSVEIGVSIFAEANGVLTQAATVVPGAVSLAPLVADLLHTTTTLGEVVNLKPIDSVPGTAPVTWSALGGPTYTPGFGALPTAPGLGSATFSWNPATQAFQFSTNGATRGSYVWTGSASNTAGSDPFQILVDVTQVPEPATFALVGLALLGFAGFRRK